MKKISYLFFLIFLIGCGSGQIKTTADTKPTETIVFGKLKLDSEKPIKDKKNLIHFNERLWATNAVYLDENGYFYTKLPLQKNSIALIEYNPSFTYYKNIPENHISVNLTSADKIYYVGDVVFKWTPTEKDERSYGGVVGALAEASKEQNVIFTVSESEETINYFKQKFPTNEKQIITQLMELK